MPRPSSTVAVPSCAADALRMAEAAWDFFNQTDVANLPSAALAESLRTWHRLEAKQTAAAIRLATAFEAAGGPAADGQKSTASWLAWFGRITRAAARGWTARARRLRGHPQVVAALADGAVTISYAEWIVEAVGSFPAAHRDEVERILVQAAADGALLEDLAEVAARMFRVLVPDGPADVEDRQEADRHVTVGRTLGGVGRINGNLDRRATALAEQVINALAVRKGPEDVRTAPQRRHDALADAFQRLLDSGLLPERGGTKPHVRVDIPLAILRRLRNSGEAEEEWIRCRAAALAARHRAAGDPLAGENDLSARPVEAPPGEQHGPMPVSPSAPARDTVAPDTSTSDALHPDVSLSDTSLSDTSTTDASGTVRAGPGACGAVRPVVKGPDTEPDCGGSGAVLGGVGPISDRLAGALACDAMLTPTVTGSVDRRALADMTDHWLSAHGLAGRPLGRNGSEDMADAQEGGAPRPARALGEGSVPGVGPGRRSIPSMSAQAYRSLQESMLRWAIEVVSGPGGLASYLRTRVPDAALNGPSIVLDVGADARAVPAALERAVRRRDGTCRFPACDQPAELAQVHHIVPREEHGPTSLSNLIVLCSFHHLTVVHTWRWTIRLDPDGIVTATSPRGVELRGDRPPDAQPPLRAA